MSRVGLCLLFMVGPLRIKKQISVIDIQQIGDVARILLIIVSKSLRRIINKNLN